MPIKNKNIIPANKQEAKIANEPNSVNAKKDEETFGKQKNAEAANIKENASENKTDEKESKLAGNIRNIYCRLINTERVKENLENIPHEKILDMVMTYYVRFVISQGEYLSVMVNNKLMESWNISKEQLKDIAWCNTLRDNPAVFTPLDSIFEELGVNTEPNERSIYVISNEKRNLGAVCIVYPGFLEKAAEEFKSDFYVLPSSVHECLAVPCDDLCAGDLRKMVRSINRTELKSNEILSDSVYRYSRSRKSLVIDNS